MSADAAVLRRGWLLPWSCLVSPCTRRRRMPRVPSPCRDGGRDGHHACRVRGGGWPRRRGRFYHAGPEADSRSSRDWASGWSTRWSCSGSGRGHRARRAAVHGGSSAGSALRRPEDWADVASKILPRRPRAGGGREHGSRGWSCRCARCRATDTACGLYRRQLPRSSRARADTRLARAAEDRTHRRRGDLGGGEGGRGRAADSLAGRDFAAVAGRDRATRPAKGGDLGYLHRGMLPDDAQKALDAATPGAIVGPCHARGRGRVPAGRAQGRAPAPPRCVARARPRPLCNANGPSSRGPT